MCTQGLKTTLFVPSQLHSERDVILASQRRVQRHFDYQLCKYNTPVRNEEQTDHKQIRCFPKINMSAENVINELWHQSDVANLYQVC